MPFSLSIQVQPRVAHVRLEGALAPAEIRRACSSLLSSPDWSPGTPQVWDFSGVDAVSSDPTEWGRVIDESERLASKIGPNRSAAVVTRPDVEAFLRTYADRFRDTGRSFYLSETRWDAVDWLMEAGTKTE